MDVRFQQVQQWLKTTLNFADFALEPASNDASFRRYFRVTHRAETFIVMDAPPQNEDCRPFIRVAQSLSGFGLNVPQVLAQDLAQGFLLLSDLGSEQYLAALNEQSVDHLYGDAISALVCLQQADGTGLPAYDRDLLMKEMELFPDWLLVRHLGVSQDEADALIPIFDWLADKALEQPRAWVHRDYHSRNLMVTAKHNPGVLDFQDAVFGPATYDLVSLLKDCYITWPEAQVKGWVALYFKQAQQAGLLAGVSLAQLLEWFDLMGVQRHLKASGIFARLNDRDGKPSYLADIPRTLAYVLAVCQRQPKLHPLKNLLEARVLPRLTTSSFC